MKIWIDSRINITEWALNRNTNRSLFRFLFRQNNFDEFQMCCRECLLQNRDDVKCFRWVSCLAENYFPFLCLFLSLYHPFSPSMRQLINSIIQFENLCEFEWDCTMYIQAIKIDDFFLPRFSSKRQRQRQRRPTVAQHGVVCTQILSFYSCQSVDD